MEAMAVVAVASMAFGQLGQWQAGQQQAADVRAMGEYNRDVAEQKAQYQEQAKETDAALRQRELRRTLAAQKAKYAAAGMTVDIGSPLDLRADTLEEAAIEDSIFAHERDLAAWELRTTGSMEMASTSAEARGIERSSDYRLISGLGSVGTSKSMGTLIG